MARRPRKLTTVGGGLTGLLVFGWASIAVAQPSSRLELSWNGPPGCPSTENVQARVEALLGGGVRAGSVADVRASGQVERVDSGFRLLLTMGIGSTPSSRVIEARTCDELAGAAAIAIALLARATSEGDSAQPAPEEVPPSSATESREVPAPAPPPIPEKPKSPAESPADGAPSALRFIVDAPIGVAGWGSLPSTGLGLGAAVGVRWKALRATVGGELWLPQTETIAGFASRLTLQSGRIEGCLLQTMHGIELGPCLGAAVQRLAGEGIDSQVFSGRARNAVWFSGVGGIFGSLPTPGFAHLRWFAEASVLVSPARPRFVIDQLGLVHEPALAAPRLDLGCEWIF